MLKVIFNILMLMQRMKIFTVKMMIKFTLNLVGRNALHPTNYSIDLPSSERLKYDRPL